MSPLSSSPPAVPPAPATDVAAETHRRSRIDLWNRRAESAPGRLARYYHRRLAEVYRHLVPEGLAVLEVGSGTGDLLAALKPAVGVGVDFAPEAVRRAQARHPHLRFVEHDAHTLDLGERFDVVILSDLVNDVWDVQRVLERVRRACTPSTRVIINTYSRVWELPLAIAERVGLARPVLSQNWITPSDLENLLSLSGFETLRTFQDLLWPLETPLIARLANVVLSKIAPFRYFALTNFIVARPRPTSEREQRPPLVSVVVPARNEAGNIEQILARVPEMGAGTEIVFVEGHSTDDTYSTIEHAIAAHPERRCRLLRQRGKGKGDAVRLGFDEARGEVLMILDADLTVPPEDLPRFYAALVTGTGDLVNGVRLVYPMQDRAMRPLNLVANKFFSLAFSWLLGQSIKDTLCGTKVLRRSHYERIARNRSFFGELDPFGDFDLLLGAAKLNFKLVDMPVRYRDRTYGTTNIQRFRHGLLLLRMVLLAAGRIKFV